jgi:hypothetical protein
VKAGRAVEEDQSSTLPCASPIPGTSTGTHWETGPSLKAQPRPHFPDANRFSCSSQGLEEPHRYFGAENEGVSTIQTGRTRNCERCWILKMCLLLSPRDRPGCILTRPQMMALGCGSGSGRGPFRIAGASRGKRNRPNTKLHLLSQLRTRTCLCSPRTFISSFKQWLAVHALSEPSEAGTHSSHGVGAAAWSKRRIDFSHRTTPMHQGGTPGR